MDAGVRKRLETIVESKNLTMEKIYGQKPVSVDEMWAWCEKYSKLFAPTSAMWATIWTRLTARARRSCSRPAGRSA